MTKKNRCHGTLPSKPSQAACRSYAVMKQRYSGTHTTPYRERATESSTHCRSRWRSYPIPNKGICVKYNVLFFSVCKLEEKFNVYFTVNRFQNVTQNWLFLLIFGHISRRHICFIFFLGLGIHNIVYNFMMNQKYYHMSGINTANSDTSRDVTFFSAILKSPISRGASLHGVIEAWLINILIGNFIGKLSNTCRLNAYFFVKNWIS